MDIQQSDYTSDANLLSVGIVAIRPAFYKLDSLAMLFAIMTGEEGEDYQTAKYVESAGIALAGSEAWYTAYTAAMLRMQALRELGL